MCSDGQDAGLKLPGLPPCAGVCGMEPAGVSMASVHCCSGWSSLLVCAPACDGVSNGCCAELCAGWCRPAVVCALQRDCTPQGALTCNGLEIAESSAMGNSCCICMEVASAAEQEVLAWQLTCNPLVSTLSPACAALPGFCAADIESPFVR